MAPLPFLVLPFLVLPFPVPPLPVRPLAVAGLRPVPLLVVFFGAGLFCPERVDVARGFPVEPWRVEEPVAAGRADVTLIASWAASSSPPRERVDPFRARVAMFTSVARKLDQASTDEGVSPYGAIMYR